MSEQIDGQESLFELPAEQPEVTREELRQLASEIGQVAATRTVETEKPLSEAFADLGYSRRETLAANPPKLANPRRTKAVGPTFDPAKDPHYFKPYQKQTEEEQAEQQAVLNGPGHKAARATLAVVQMDAVSRQHEGDVRAQLAVARARADKHSRP